MPTEPKILTAPSCSLRPYKSETARIISQQDTLSTVAEYLQSCRLRITKRDESGIIAEGEGIQVIFVYEETAKNVYRAFSVFLGDQLSNIRALRNYAESFNGNQEAF